MDIIKDKTECTGCTACESICPNDAISMEKNRQGFLYPLINNNSCNSCNLCISICPVNTDRISFDIDPKVFAVKHLSDSVRYESSSGGFFTGLYEYVIDQGGAVFGVCFNENMKVIHSKSETIEGCKKFRTSKYVQSTKNKILREVKKEVKSGKLVLFTGTPCEIAGLNSFLQKKYPNLITCDFICHGVPSPGLWDEYIAYLNLKNNSRLISFSFRSKTKGWRTACIQKKFENGKLHEIELIREPFGYLFANELIFRNSCHKCRYANLNRVSDLTMGDYWGIEGISESFNDNIGISQVTVNTNQGEKILESITNNFELIQTSIQYPQMNLKKPTPCNPTSEKLWRDYHEKGFNHMIKKYRPKYTFIKQLLKRIGVFDLLINWKNQLRKSIN